MITSLKIENFKRDGKISFGSDFIFTSHKRGKINQFSEKSKRRFLFFMRNCDCEFNYIITLTYDKIEVNGINVKKHLNNFLGYLRKAKIKYAWCLEFQRRGAPHFHIMIDKKICILCYSFLWNRIIKGSYDNLNCGLDRKKIYNKDGLTIYLRKYLSKMNQKSVPNTYKDVGRFFGHSASLKLTPVFNFEITKEENISENDIVKRTRIYRRYLKAKLRRFGIKWKFKRRSFTLLDGSKFLDIVKEDIGL